MCSCSSAAVAGSCVSPHHHPISVAGALVTLSPSPLSTLHGRLCHPVTVSLSLSRVPLSPCDCLPVTVVSSSATPHHLLTLSLASLSSFYYHRASLSPLTVPLSLSQGLCHSVAVSVTVAGSSVTPHRLSVSVACVSVTLLLSQGVSVTLTVTLPLSRAPLSPLTASLSLLQVSLSPCHHVTVSLSLS